MVEKNQRNEQAKLDDHLHGLKRRLDEAWWNEEPLETILKIEKEIADRSEALQSADLRIS